MISSPAVYTDFSQLAELRHGSRSQQDQNLEQVARQFESVFTHMVIKSMRQASLGNDLFNSNAHESYRDMFDQQIALSLSQGKGLGLAEAMLRQMRPASAAISAEDVKANGLPAHPQTADTAAGRVLQKRLASGEYGPLRMTSPEAAMRKPISEKGLNRQVIAEPAAPAETLRLDQASKSEARPRSPEAFIARVWPAARRVADSLGVSPRVLVAQAALETGWGKSLPRNEAGSSNNYFGIKTHGQWQGSRVAASTTEMVDGRPVRERASFRAYDSVEASFRDFASFLKSNPRYSQALAVTHDANKFVDALQKAGYATDPAYADKIKSIMNGRRMNAMIAKVGSPGTQAV